MIALIQRVARATVAVDGQTVGEVGTGLLALIGVEAGDAARQADRLLERVLNYRIFPDAEGRMNLSLRETGGGLMLVSQFTLVADTGKGNRPGFSRGAAPAEGKKWFDYLLARAAEQHPVVASGRYGADMQVSLVNDGPVTFWLQVAPET